MVDFDFKTKADWNSGFKNNVVGDDDAPLIDVDKLAIAPEFFDPIASGSRKSGWTEHVDPTSTITDTVGTPDYMEVLQQYSGKYAHVQRPPTADMLPPNSNSFYNVCHIKAIDDNNTQNWNPGIAVYWDTDNWCRVRFDMVLNELVAEANINGTIFDFTIPSFAIALNTWYELFLWVTKQGSLWHFDAFARTPHGSFTYLGGSTLIPFWNFDPNWIIFGSGITLNPSYPVADFNNSLVLVDAQKESHLAMFGIWPLNGQAGSWQSPSISMPSGKRLKDVIIEQDYGDISNRYINIVNILRASDDVVLSTWTGTEDGDFSLSEDDFDNGLGVTESIDIKIEVWLFSSTKTSYSELDRVAGNLEYLWIAQETIGVSDKTIAEVDILIEESVGLSDLDIADVEALFEETLGFSDQDIVEIVLRALETLGFSDVETVEMDILMAEGLGLSDLDVAEFEAYLAETLGFSDDVFQMTEVLVGIRGFIAPLLDITNFDYCAAIVESGHVVTKKGTPDELFQAMFYRKQVGQRFDIDIELNPGDAVMFYCPDQEVTIAVDDVLEYNSLEYTVISIRQKDHDGNPIYKKAACQLTRAVGVPAVTNPAASSSSAGQALATWDEVETTEYPSFDYYEVWMKKGAGSYQLVVETTGVTHTQRNLVADTYYFKIRAVDKVAQQGTFSGEVSVVVA